MARFLRFSIEQTLAGKASELKEYLIGVEVFDRGPDFDPRTDPIVRVEARRLRTKLRDYYGGDGKTDPILFELTAGTYAPTIVDRNRTARSAEPDVHTVAVLPFANLSATPDHDYFTDGLTEELIHALTKLSGMRVLAWNSTAQLRGVENDIHALRRRLEVGNVITGSVRIAGKQLRVRAQLIDTETGVYLWSETFDRQMQDVFAIQEEIARAIVRTLRIQLGGGGQEPLVARGATDLSAYDCYLKGRYHWHRRTPDDLALSMQYFQAAVTADTHSALGYAGMADACVLLVEYGLLHPTEGIAKATAAAERAIQLDGSLAEAYPSLAAIRCICEGNWQEGESLYRRAIALNPGYATAHHWLGFDCLACQGRLEEAAEEMEIAIQFDPLSSVLYESRAYLWILERQYEKALQGFREILKFEPNYYRAYTGMGRAYSLLGRHVEALAMLEKGRSMADEVPNILAAMGHVFGLSGDHASARGILAQLEARSREVYIPCTCFAIVHLGLGEHEQALDWLEKACAQREMTLITLKMHPIYEALRNEPRFQAVLRRLGLA
jgi:TolB-like protein/tetratricopeptide (TPR) repeat protein